MRLEVPLSPDMMTAALFASGRYVITADDMSGDGELWGDVNFTEWVRLQGIHPQTAYRWLREGMLPVPAMRVNSRSVLVAPDAVIAPARGGIGRYARVSSHDQGAGLDRRVARLTAWAAQSGRAVVRVEAEVGSGMNGARSKARRLLADPACRR